MTPPLLLNAILALAVKGLYDLPISRTAVRWLIRNSRITYFYDFLTLSLYDLRDGPLTDSEKVLFIKELDKMVSKLTIEQIVFSMGLIKTMSETTRICRLVGRAYGRHPMTILSTFVSDTTWYLDNDLDSREERLMFIAVQLKIVHDRAYKWEDDSKTINTIRSRMKLLVH